MPKPPFKLKLYLRNNWQISLIIMIALFLRFFRLENLVNFMGDQGIDLLVVKKMIVEHRWTLLGPKTSLLPIYNGPIYYYMLFPVLSLFKLNPISTSYFMIFVWVGAIYLTFVIGNKFINYRTGILASFFFTIWPLGIEYSRESFNSFPTPFFSAVFILSLFVYIKNKKLLLIFLTGLSFGIMMQLHYFNFLLILPIIFFITKKKLGIKSIIIFIFGFIIMFSPMILFEMRHNFFNLRTLVFSLKQNHLSNFNFKIHYFICIFPIIFLLIGRFVDLLIKANKSIGTIVVIIFITINLGKIDLFRNNGGSMPKGWNYIGVKKAGEIIANDAGKNFNVASIIDGDTRAYPFRYIIEINGKIPMAVEEYPRAEELYIISRGDDNYVLNYPVWEIQSFLPAKVGKEWQIQNGFSVFKLVKETNNEKN